MRKAAVVIGVSRTGGLKDLESVIVGAENTATWLTLEGFDVECVTDKECRVDFLRVETAIKKFVTNPPRYHLLVVYFSGHGYWKARSDIWLLSDAPVRPDEAINLTAAIELAKYSGIPNVVFISDACRSVPGARDAASVEGRGVFPNYADIVDVSKIDFFKATTESLPAYEVMLDGKPQSTLTAALTSAYENPEPDMVHTIVDGAQSIEVVPNRRLEIYLQKKVDEILAKVDITLSQRIDVSVPSSDDIYIARVRRTRPRLPARRGPPALAMDSLPDTFSTPAPALDAAEAVTRSLARPYFEATADPILLSIDASTRNEVGARLPNRHYEHFETQMGFIVRGASAARVAVAGEGRKAALVEAGNGRDIAGVVRIDSQEPVSVVLELSDGRCAILAGLPGHIGHAIFKAEGMANVSYVPSSNHPRWFEYQHRRDDIDRFRAMVALAVDQSSFRLPSPEAGEELARRIRMGKAIDPTLGLYAAYAFSQAGNENQVDSVLRHMRDDLGVDLFDTRLLASRRMVGDSALRIVPFCPMLTQSWHAARARELPMNDVFHDVFPSLCNSLWTTFEPEAGQKIFTAVQRGDLT